MLKPNLYSDDSDREESIVDINTTPLIDVMLVLLIMLIITIPLQTQSVTMIFPHETSQPKTPRSVMTVSITNDNLILWNGQTLESEDDMEDHLKSMLIGPDDQRPELHVRPEQQCDYRTVLHVMAAAQKLGITRMGIVSK